jgi:hypothetical protein
VTYAVVCDQDRAHYNAGNGLTKCGQRIEVVWAGSTKPQGAAVPDLQGRWPARSTSQASARGSLSAVLAATGERALPGALPRTARGPGCLRRAADAGEGAPMSADGVELTARVEKGVRLSFG